MNPKYLVLSLLSSFVLASCLPTNSNESLTSSSSTSSSSEPSSSQGPLKVSQMMANMEDQNYTLDLSINGETMYAYEVALPLLRAFIEVEGDSVEAFLDLTDENVVYLYLQDPSIGEGWIKQQADPFSLFYVVAPLSFLNVAMMQDAWFTFDETNQNYTFDMDYIDVILGEDTETEGLESLTIEGDASSVTITLDGYNPETMEPQTIVFEYGSFGTTSVVLPTNLLDYTQIILEETIFESDNHSYSLDVFNDNPNFLYELLGYRDGGTFLTERSISDGDTILNEERYYDETGLEIMKTDDSYTSAYVDTLTYDQALLDFYPIAFHALQYEWLEPTGESTEWGETIYEVDSSTYDAWLHLDVLFPVSDIETVELIIGESFFIGTYLTMRIEFMVGIDAYELIFEAHTFGYTYVEMPTDGQTYTVNEAAAFLASSTNYRLNQYLMNDETSEFEQDAIITRDGHNASIRYDILDFDVYYERVGDGLREYRYSDELLDYVQTDVHPSMFETEILDAHWINQEELTSEMVVPFLFSEDMGMIDPTLYATTLVSDELLSRFDVIEIDVFSDNLEGVVSLFFSLTLEEKTTETTYYAYVSYDEINQAELTFPTDGVV